MIEPTSWLSLTFGYIHAYVNDAHSLAFTPIGNVLNAGVNQGYPSATGMTDKTSLNFQPLAQTTTNEGNLIAVANLGKYGTLTSSTSYRTEHIFNMFDFDFTTADPAVNAFTTFDAYEVFKRQTFTQQLDYSGKIGERLDLLAGVFYYDDHAPTPFNVSSFEPGPPVVVSQKFNATAWAVYLDGTYRFTDNLYLTVGGRYSVDHKYLAESGSAANYHVDDSAFTPRGVLRYSLDPYSNVYASVSQGFKAGTINNAFPFNTVKPETITAYEAGYKRSHGPLRERCTGFYYDYKNNQVQLTTVGGIAGPGIHTPIENSGGAQVYGAEASINYQVTDHLNVHAGLSALHARFTDFPNGPNVILAGINTTVTAPWTGRQLPRAPDWSGSFGADYTMDVMNGKLVLTGNGTFTSSYAPDDASYQCTPVAGVCPGSSSAPGRFVDPAYALLNLQAAWTDPNQRWTFTLYGTNVTNTRYKTESQGFLYGTIQVLNQPATGGIRVAFKY